MKKIDLTTKFNEKAIQLYLKMKHKQGKYTVYSVHNCERRTQTIEYYIFTKSLNLTNKEECEMYIRAKNCLDLILKDEQWYVSNYNNPEYNSALFYIKCTLPIILINEESIAIRRGIGFINKFNELDVEYVIPRFDEKYIHDMLDRYNNIDSLEKKRFCI